MMDGKSTSDQTTSQTQQSTTNPWAQANPALTGILGQLQGGLNNTGVTGAENGALNTITNNANTAAGTYAPQIGGYATSLLGGGGALNQAGAVNQNYQNYNSAVTGGAQNYNAAVNNGASNYNTGINNGAQNYNTALTGANTTANANLGDLTTRLSGTADGSNMNGNSGLKPYLDTLQNDITNSTNGTFAAAGRDFSGANSMALGRGITQGLAPVIAGQYNTDNQNRINAAQSIFDAGNTTNAFTTGNTTAGYNAGRSAADAGYGATRSAADAGYGATSGAAGAAYGAGNTNAGILAGLQQQYLTNQGAGVGAASSATDASNAGANAALQAEAQRRNIPVQALGLLAQIGIPIAGLGGTSSGTATGQSNTTNQMSGAQQFGLIANGIGGMGNAATSLFGGGGANGGGAIAGISKLFG